MTDKAEHQDVKSSARGEAAWKEERERIADRNQAARKAGKEEREAYEKQRAASRRAHELKRESAISGKARNR